MYNAGSAITSGRWRFCLWTSRPLTKMPLSDAGMMDPSFTHSLVMVLISGKSGRRMDFFEDCAVCAYTRKMEEQNKQLVLEELREAFLQTQQGGTGRR